MQMGIVYSFLIRGSSTLLKKNMSLFVLNVSKSLITAHAVYQERFIEYPLKKINIKGPDIPSGPFIFI
jgi:hypothetical protein